LFPTVHVKKTYKRGSEYPSAKCRYCYHGGLIGKVYSAAFEKELYCLPKGTVLQ
jgi:hypothetical protein